MLFTAESVSPKHPDKICDQISDAILDAHLTQDPDCRAGIDVAGGHGIVYVTGEITSKAQNISVEQIVKQYAPTQIPLVNIVQQSPEIAQGVDSGGAGDQGIMIGYACNSNNSYMPQEYYLARSLNQYLFQRFPFDGKTQITIDEQGTIKSLVASFQNTTKESLTNTVYSWLEKEQQTLEGELLLNPAGDWKIGGFDADAGLTGRKLAVDSYGPRIPIGGGAFSGKDPTKVDRSAAYMARRIAVDYLKKYEAKEVQVKLAYAIGYSQPVEATATIDGKQNQIKGYDLSPQGIIETLQLKQPIYTQTSKYGHFGHKFRWDS